MKKLKAVVLLAIGTLVCILIYLTAIGTTAYAWQAINGHLAIMNQRVPIETALQNSGFTQEEKRKLRLAVEVSEFARNELGLPKNDSYRFYSDIGRSTLGWNVYAAPKLSIEAKKWCYPLLGCLVYRGYFSEAKARDLAANIKRNRSHDVFVGPITAYSSLGYFDDPVLSTHLKLPDFRLAALIIHEMAHQRLIIEGNSSLTEAFAVVVEREGLRRFAASTGRTNWEELIRFAWNDDDGKVEAILKARTELGRLYGDSIDDDAKLAKKREIIDGLKAQVCGASCADAELPKAGDRPFELNNAYLLPVQTYYGKFSELQVILNNADSNLEKFYELIESNYKD